MVQDFLAHQLFLVHPDIPFLLGDLLDQVNLVIQLDLVHLVFHQHLEFLGLLGFLVFREHQGDPLNHVYPVNREILVAQDLR